MGLTLLQVAVGVGNVVMRVPTWMSALHLGVAASILATLVVLTHRAARLPARALHVVPVEAR
jgi:heme A synthase